MYATILEQEHSASQNVVALDRRLRWMQDRETTADRRLAFLESERKLFRAELPINENLQALYTAASTNTANPRDNEILLIRTALLHWTILLRRTSLRSFHTEVDGLTDDPVCRGDIIADQLLVRYFDSLFEQYSETPAEAASVQRLLDLARQSACLGTQQSALLARSLYWSFHELRAFLRVNGLERLVPYVAQAAAAPMLLFYDVEKYRGPQAPLSRWFGENYAWLIQGAERRRIPVAWHGLWLYDRRSGRLIGYRPTSEPADENEVHLPMFLASIIKRENLGMYDCSFAEMIERGASSQGYLCVGSICEQEQQTAEGSLGSSQERLNSLWQFSRGFGWGSAEGTLCSQSSPWGGSGVTGGDNSLCGDGVSGFARNWAGETVRCLTEQAMKPGGALLRCAAEATGLCSPPIATSAKMLQPTVFAGIRLGSDCQRSAGAKGSGMGDVKLAEYEAERQRQERLDDIGTELLLIEAAVQQYEDEAEAATTEEGEAAALKKADEALVRAKELLEEMKKLEEQAPKTPAETGEGGRPACPPDMPDCGGNECTGMSAAAMQTLRCFQQEASEDELEELQRQPGFVDPAPEDVPAEGGMGKCFEAFSAEVSTVHKACWAYDCGPEGTTGMASNGIRCTCGGGPTGDPSAELRGMCDTIRCPDDLTPVVMNGLCACGGGLGSGVSGGTFGGDDIPTGSFTPSAPRFFSEVRFEDMPPQGEGMPPSALGTVP